MTHLLPEYSITSIASRVKLYWVPPFFLQKSHHLCTLLFRTRLIPRWLAISGVIGYSCLMAGSVAEILGIHIGLVAGLPPLTIPGFFFELVLPFWLIIKGFQREAYGQDV